MNSIQDVYKVGPQESIQTTIEKSFKGILYAGIPLTGSAVTLLTGCYQLIKTGSPLGSTMVAAGLGIMVLGMKEKNQQAVKLGAGLALFGAYGLITTSSKLGPGLLVTGIALGCLAGLQISIGVIKIPVAIATAIVEPLNNASKAYTNKLMNQKN